MSLRADTLKKTSFAESMNVIPSNEVNFHPHSFGDHQLRLFFWNGQMYRAIGAEYVAFYRRLFENHLIQSLVDKNLLVESEVTPFSVSGYEMVVRHRKLDYPSYPNEWCPAMLKDAALAILDLAIELAPHGLTLGDAHPWNLLFDIDRQRSVFVDLGSLVPLTDFVWPHYDEFCRFCLYPLLLMSHREDQLARLLMWEDKGVQESDIRKCRPLSTYVQLRRYRSLLARAESLYAKGVPDTHRIRLKRSWRALKGTFAKCSQSADSFPTVTTSPKQNFHRNFLKRIRRDVERIEVSISKMKSDQGVKYHTLSSLSQENWTATKRTLHTLLTKIQPRTVLALGTDNEWTSKLAADLGSRVVSWDTNPNRVNQLYRDALRLKMPILPLVMDFTKPTPARGLGCHWSISAIERFRCDMVLALGLLPNIVCERRLNFEQIVDGLALLAKRCVIVEFVSAEDDEVKFNWPVRRSWYTLSNCFTALQTRFTDVHIIPTANETRHLLLCER